VRVTGFWGAVGALVGGFMLADVLTHPAGTKQAGGVITQLWKTSAAGASGQTVSGG
jgi:hypothetical protein